MLCAHYDHDRNSTKIVVHNIQYNCGYARSHNIQYVGFQPVIFPNIFIIECHGYSTKWCIFHSIYKICTNVLPEFSYQFGHRLQAWSEWINLCFLFIPEAQNIKKCYFCNTNQNLLSKLFSIIGLWLRSQFINLFFYVII